MGSLVRVPQSKIRRTTDWGIYLGVAASVVSGLLIAYLRPGAVIIPESRGFSTSIPALNFALEAHAFIAIALEWLCGFHVVYSLWYWLIKGTKRGQDFWRLAGGSCGCRKPHGPQGASVQETFACRARLD